VAGSVSPFEVSVAYFLYVKTDCPELFSACPETWPATNPKSPDPTRDNLRRVILLRGVVRMYPDVVVIAAPIDDFRVFDCVRMLPYVIDGRTVVVY
jgi:hypothetical protein